MEHLCDSCHYISGCIPKPYTPVSRCDGYKKGVIRPVPVDPNTVQEFDDTMFKVVFYNGVAYHPTWEIIDSTKLSEYMRCPRMYFYKYICGWQTDNEHNDLVFGSAWHEAQEHLLLYGYEQDSVLEAYHKFEDYYRQYYSPDTDDIYYPKCPATVIYYLPAYCARYAADHREYKTLYTEVGGSISIGDNRRMHFKMDSILQHLRTGRIKSREHKTGKTNSRAWRDKWLLAVQPGTYDHALRCMYGNDIVDGIEISGAFFTKGHMEVLTGNKRPKAGDEGPFLRIPITKQPDMSNVWLNMVNKWFDKVEADMRMLKECDMMDMTVMPCFDMNVESCTDFWGCQFLDLCTSWANPLKHVHTPPMGYNVYRWNPADEGKMKVTL